MRNGPFEMMGGWDGSGWLWPFHFLVPLLFLALVIAVIVLAARYAMGWGGHPIGVERRSSALDVLEERYARGEINRDEYLEKKRDITG